MFFGIPGGRGWFKSVRDGLAIQFELILTSGRGQGDDFCKVFRTFHGGCHPPYIFGIKGFMFFYWGYHPP